MALISCGECGKPASSDTEKCPRIEKSDFELLFEALQWIKAQGICLPSFNISSFLNDFLTAEKTGFNNKMKEIIQNYIPFEKVEWHKFSQSYQELNGSFVFQRKKDIEKMFFLDLLKKKNAVDLKGIFQKFFPNERSGKFTKGQLVERLSSSLQKGEKEVIEASIKEELIKPLDAEIKNIRTESMLQMFFGQIMKKFNLLKRRQQMTVPSVFSKRPYWQIVISDDTNSPDSCKKLKNLIKKNTDLFWDENFPPHEDLKCSCYVVSLSERDLKREFWK